MRRRNKCWSETGRALGLALGLACAAGCDASVSARASGVVSGAPDAAPERAQGPVSASLARETPAGADASAAALTEERDGSQDQRPAPPSSEAETEVSQTFLLSKEPDEPSEEELPSSFRVSERDLVIRGPMDKAMVRRVFRHHRRKLEACARKVAARGEDPRGTLELRLMLMDTPKPVRAVSVKRNTTKSRRALSRCIERAMRSWSWPTNYVCGAAELEVALRVK